ncbi:transposon Tf2-11 polyprotein [Trichonephila clavipes]|nr:transposon Tf2-11 polyprotein [Trichonephila clavipes]
MECIPGKSNVVADMLSRPACHEENELCEVCTVAIDVLSRSPKEIRDEQMKDEELVKIISCLEDPDKNVNYVNWVERGYLMNQGVLFRYAPDSESEEAQLEVPSHERTLILKNHPDAEMAGHYGAEGTYTRIAKNYYWTEVLLRYGIPRRLISDNETQFVSAVMQQICYLLNIHQSLIPVYHPQANPVERKNRDLKPRLHHILLSNAARGRSAKLMPRRDGPYVILTQRSPSSYEIASLDNPGEPLGVYPTSALTPCDNDKVKPLIPLRKRGRPPKVPQTHGSSSGRRRNQRGEDVTNVKSCLKETHFTSVEVIQAKTENLLKGLPKTSFHRTVTSNGSTNKCRNE